MLGGVEAHPEGAGQISHLGPRHRGRSSLRVLPSIPCQVIHPQCPSCVGHG